MAFDQDFGREDYIKGLLSLDSTTGAGTMKAWSTKSEAAEKFYFQLV